jgi:hypothetical protein
MDCDGTDCDGCAVCDTLDMSSEEPWKPTWLTGAAEGRCAFCRQHGQIAYYTALGMTVGHCCARRPSN